MKRLLVSSLLILSFGYSSEDIEKILLHGVEKGEIKALQLAVERLIFDLGELDEKDSISKRQERAVTKILEQTDSNFHSWLSGTIVPKKSVSKRITPVVIRYLCGDHTVPEPIPLLKIVVSGSLNGEIKIRENYPKFRNEVKLSVLTVYGWEREPGTNRKLKEALSHLQREIRSNGSHRGQKP